MGDVLSKAADGVGNGLAAPLKAMLGGSCEDVCSGGVWDITCFITHLCVSDLMRLFMILILCYITLLFIYLFFKLGICKCVGKSFCKMYCSACKAYWSALGFMACFFWHKLTNVKRVNRRRRRRRRRRFPDVENSESSSTSGGGSVFVDRDNVCVSRKRKVIMKDQMESSRHHNHHRRRHHHKGKSIKLKKLRHRHHHPRKNTVVRGTETASFKRRRLV